MVLEALRLVEKRNLAAMGHNSAQHIHHVAEALKLAAADREVYFGDPKFVDVPLDQLLSDANIAERLKSLRTDRAWPEMPPSSVLPGRAPITWKPDPSSNSEASALDREAIPETSYLCVVDEKGNVFSSTPSDGTISGPVVPGTGMTTSMWGSRAYTDPAHPAAVGPGRRPRMSANPMIAMRKGEMVMPLGSPGSEVLGQAQVQAFLNKVVFGMDPQAAVEAPRVASYSWPGSALPPQLFAGPAQHGGAHRPRRGRRTTAHGPQGCVVAQAQMDCRIGLHDSRRFANRPQAGRRRSPPNSLCHRLVRRGGH